MTRKIDFEDWQRKRAHGLETRAKLGFRRGVARRPRDAEERALLLQLDEARRKRWELEGKIQKTGPRSYRVTLD